MSSRAELQNIKRSPWAAGSERVGDLIQLHAQPWVTERVPLLGRPSKILPDE